MPRSLAPRFSSHHNISLKSISHAVPGKGPGKVPVHYFGTLEFAWLKPGEVCSFQAGLQAGMHICKARTKNKPAFKKALHEVHVYFMVS